MASREIKKNLYQCKDDAKTLGTLYYNFVYNLQNYCKISQNSMTYQLVLQILCR